MPAPVTDPRRARVRRMAATGAVPLIVAAGLLSRRSVALTAMVGKYPGDALWAAMVYAAIVVVVPRLSRLHVGIAAFGACGMVEAFQLVQAPWLSSIRATTIGHLVLGSTFHVPDFAAYAVGVLVAWGVDRLLGRRTTTG